MVEAYANSSRASCPPRRRMPIMSRSALARNATYSASVALGPMPLFSFSIPSQIWRSSSVHFSRKPVFTPPPMSAFHDPVARATGSGPPSWDRVRQVHARTSASRR